MAPDNSNTNNNNNNSSKSNKMDKQMQKQLKHRREEMVLFNRFKSIATSKLERMAGELEASGIKYKMGEEEKRVVRQMNGMGLKEGVAAGVVSFLILRKGPIYISRFIYKRRMQQQQAQGGGAGAGAGARGARMQQPPSGPPPPMSQPGMTLPPASNGGFQLSNPNAAASSSANPFVKAAAANNNSDGVPRKGNIVRRSIWFIFDSMLSLMIAASVSITYTDTDKIRQQLLELPLIPGPSLTSDALCDEIALELQKVQAEHDPAYERLSKLNNSNDQGGRTPASSYLEGIVAFSANCQRRRFVERQLRQERGLSTREAVEISEPISRDGPRLVVKLDGEERVVDNDEFENEFHDLGWASNFVSDQEEEAGYKDHNNNNDERFGR